MRASQGQAFPPPPLRSAGAINGWMEVSENFQQQKRLGNGGGMRLRPPGTTVVKVRNDTGAALRKGEVIDLNTQPLTGDPDRTYPWFVAAVPNELRVSAIVLEPIPEDEYGDAQLAGICPALVNFSSTTHKFARVSSGNDVLQSNADSGPARVVVAPASTGEQMVWVVLGEGLESAGIYLAKVPVGGIPARAGTTPGSAAVALWKVDGGGLVDTGLVATVYNIYPLAYTFDASDPYIQVAQDRYGLWFAEDPPESDTGYAKFIGFTISNTTGGLMKANNDQMAATVDYIIQGTTPPLDGNGELIVHDDQEVCPNAIAGGSGWAMRNDNLGGGTPYYQILVCNQMCRQARATLAETMDGSKLELAIQNFFPDDESPEGLDAIAPFRNYALNPHARMGRNGQQVRLRWGNTISAQGVPRQGYIIEDVKRISLELPVNFRITSDKKIQVQYLQQNIETYKNEVANEPWTDMFPSKNCT